MRYHREDVVERALGVLDAYGLADLTMRRLGTELGVQPSALYHHFANKQQLLAAVADEILARGPHAPRPERWDDRVALVCTELRDAMLAYRDGADVVATSYSFGLGAAAPYAELAAALADGGLEARLVPTAARTLLHFVFGHVTDEQTHLQASSAGAIGDDLDDDLDHVLDDPWPASDFAAGLGLVLDGIRVANRSGIEKQPS